MPICPLSAFATWGAKRWLTATVVTVVTFYALGLSTAVLPNPVFGRSIPPTNWAMDVLVATSILTGLLSATYVSATPQGLDHKGTVGALLSYLAIGCPVCNKLALIALGTTGAVRIFAPMQPYLAVAGLLFLGWALTIRLRGEMVCAWSPSSEDPGQGFWTESTASGPVSSNVDSHPGQPHVTDRPQQASRHRP